MIRWWRPPSGRRISGSPGAWQLYNETLEAHLAKPIDSKYQVYYDPVDNTVFCDWERLVGVESSTHHSHLRSLKNPIDTRATSPLIRWIAVVNSNNAFNGEIV
jgi:hypothetical protein